MEPRVLLPLPPCEWVSRYDATRRLPSFLTLSLSFCSFSFRFSHSRSISDKKRSQKDSIPISTNYRHDFSRCYFLCIRFFCLSLFFYFYFNQPRFASTERIYWFSERAINDRYLYWRDVKGYFSREIRDEDFVLVRYSTLLWQNILILACFGKLSMLCTPSYVSSQRYFVSVLPRSETPNG